MTTTTMHPILYCLREKTKELSSFLFITPEHNRTIPAAFKNALDIGSRPYGKSIWNAKPGAIISVSPGLIGGFSKWVKLVSKEQKKNKKPVPLPQINL